MRWFHRAAAALALALPAVPAAAQDRSPVRIFFIDGLSGPLALPATRGERNFRWILERINREGGLAGRPVEFQTCDNKLQPRETQACFERAVTAGAQYVTQGLSSGASVTLIRAVERHNARNPGREIMFLNWAGQDSALTGEHCSPWQVRFDASNEMKIAALVAQIATMPEIRRVFLINQDYSQGQTYQRVTREMLRAKRPDIEIVGDELHPPSRVQDWSPYVARIRASNADTVITGAIGQDLARLIRSSGDAGVDLRWFTSYGSMIGTIPQVGAYGVGRVYQASDFHLNVEDPETQDMVSAYAAGANGEMENLRAFRTLRMLQEAVTRAGTADPARVRDALFGLRMRIATGENVVREDGQVIMPVVVSMMTDDVPRTQEGTRWSFRTVSVISPEIVAQPSDCRVRAPRG